VRGKSSSGGLVKSAIEAPKGDLRVCVQAWPAMLRGVHGDRERYEKTYFAPYPGYYCAGDSARRDADGYYWIQGRIDDVLNVSGHRIGTSEVEAALSAHDGVAEAAVIGMPHAVKGQGICAFVTLKDGAPERGAAQGARGVRAPCFPVSQAPSRLSC
jgi:acetyl-CoA synthetase